jgi:hypothetical protein
MKAEACDVKERKKLEKEITKERKEGRIKVNDGKERKKGRKD